jgi:hypothetical protein
MPKRPGSDEIWSKTPLNLFFIIVVIEKAGTDIVTLTSCHKIDEIAPTMMLKWQEWFFLIHSGGWSVNVL